VYVPAALAVTLCVVWFPGVHRYVYGVVPPLAVAVNVTEGVMHVSTRGSPASTVGGSQVVKCQTGLVASEHEIEGFPATTLQ
jgi:hypothetical protein